jgi:hypothetical protein
MVMGADDMNYINPAGENPTGRGNEARGPAAKRDYEKHPERVFRSKQDIVVPAGTVFARAPLERGGVDRTEGIVALGSDATAYLNLPVRVAEIDAKEWFEEITSRKEKEGVPSVEGTLTEKE